MFFGGVGGELAAVQGELFDPDELQLRADHEDLHEQVLDMLALGRDEGSDGGVVGFGFTGESHENDVVPAGGFDSAGEQDSFGVGVEDDLDHRLR